MRRIDFLHRKRQPGVGWLLLAAGVAALLSAGFVTNGWSVLRAEAQRQRHAQEEAAARAHSEARRPVPPSPAQIRLAQVAPDLRQPWLPTLKVIESASTPPVFVLSLAITPGSGQVRLEAEAPTFVDALAYVRSLNEEGVLEGAQLRTHETAADPLTNQPIVRFGVTAQWVAR